MVVLEPGKVELNKRLERISWGLFLIMLGGFALVPSGQLPSGAWLIGLGVILLGLNGVRSMMDIPISWFTTVLGAVALVAGSGDIAGVDVPVGPVLLIIIGAAILLRGLDPRRS